MRLVTRSDFDGLICAMLLKKVEEITEIKFVHPKDLQDGKFDVRHDDILTNVPFVPGCGLWFDHHATEVARVVNKYDYCGDCRVAPSAARVVYDFYGGKTKFGNIDEMMVAVDKADSAQFTADEIMHPKGWDLLSFVMDARTGLGRYNDYRISNYQLMYDLIDACSEKTIDQVLAMPDIVQRTQRYFDQEPLFKTTLLNRSVVHGDVIVTDMRDADPIPCGNRFLIYALHPLQNISIWIVNGRGNQNCVFACGHSIVNRSSTVDVGVLMRRYGGGGHHVAGTCQVEHADSAAVLAEIVSTMNLSAQHAFSRAA